MNNENQQNSKESQFMNTDRDESTLGTSSVRRPKPEGVADEDKPVQRPPETQPEPRPMNPIMSPNSSQTTNTNSPA